MRPAVLSASLLLLAPAVLPADPPKLPPLATRADVQAVLDELAAPTVFGSDPTPVPPYPFAAAALERYAPDRVSVADVRKEPEKYRYRAAVLRAVGHLRGTPAPGHPEGKAFPLRVGAEVTDEARRDLARVQEVVAVAAATLEVDLEELTAVAGGRDGEPRRWQAHHDLVTAEVRARLVLLNEYNLMLGHVRTEALPPLPPGATGWRLVGSPKVQSRGDVKKLATAAAEGFRAVAEDHRGTPWAALADRALRAAPGLAWEAEPGK